MDSKNKLTRFLAVTGTVMIWLPVFFTVLISTIHFTISNKLRVDYLMPAELFPVALIGGLLLFWAALRIRTQYKMVGLLILAMFSFLAAGQIFAIVTGQASGAVKPEGWFFATAITFIALYTITLIVLGISGVLFIKNIYRKVTPVALRNGIRF